MGDSDSGDTPASKRQKTSDVWKHFKLNADKKYAKCVKCQKSYKTSGNTSNLIDHLKRAHPFLGEPKKPTSTMRHFFKQNDAYDNNSVRKAELDSALTRMIAIDVQPFRIVEDEGFRDFVRRLDPRYCLPSRNTIQKVHLKNLYDDVKTKLQAALNKVDSCAVTTDAWSSKANESYLTVTCHFIDGDFKLRSAVLTTSKLVNELNHSAENISGSLRECLQNWNIFHKVNCVVTDNAASMIKACELLQKRHLPCFAHSINLVVQDTLSTEKVKALLTKCKRIVAYFKSSTIAYAKLKKEQGDEKQYSLIQEVSTRWNSAFAMVQRILLIKNAIFAVLLRTPKAPQVLTAEEIEQLQDMCLLLEPFNTYTNVLSGNQYVTISHVIPIAWGLHSTITNLKSKLQTAVGLETQLYLSEKIKQRLFSYETRSVSRLATLLDPRFKKEGFQSGQNAAQASMLLENELIEINRIAASTSSDNREEPSTSSNIKTPHIYEFLTERLSCKIKSNRADAIITLREYTEKQNEPLDIDPLEYWKTRSNEMKSMQVLACKYLCIPATSTESERMFSKAGELVSDRRTRLKDRNVDMLLFINKNHSMG